MDTAPDTGPTSASESTSEVGATEGSPQPSPAAKLNAGRALAAYNAMQEQFYAADGSSLYFETPRAAGGRAYSALWPFTRALAATLDLEGVDEALLPGFSSYHAMVDRLAGLGHYWDAHSNPPGYCSGPAAPFGGGGDKYYDDNAWVGLALIQHDRLRTVPSSLRRAEEVFTFVLTGWDEDGRHAYPGGMFWVQQGRGRGTSDHNRHTISNAPNAQLGFHLHELTGSARFDGGQGRAGAHSMYEWVNNSPLNQSKKTPEPETGLYLDHLNPEGEITGSEIWTYNQGAMIAANVLAHRLTGQPESLFLTRAEAIATKALAHYRGTLLTQPEEFNAIFFRNLLQLHDVTSGALQQQIVQTISDYADQAWEQLRGSDGLFPKGAPAMKKHAAMIQIFAVLAWEPGSYGHLA